MHTGTAALISGDRAHDLTLLICGLLIGLIVAAKRASPEPWGCFTNAMMVIWLLLCLLFPPLALALAALFTAPVAVQRRHKKQRRVRGLMPYTLKPYRWREQESPTQFGAVRYCDEAASE
jgi:hypothetical protein